MFLQGYIGPLNRFSSTSFSPFFMRGGQLSAVILSQCNGKYYENTYNSNTFSGGITSTAAVNANTTLTSSGIPMLGVWNPINSGVNVVMLQALLGWTNIAANAVSPQGVVWAASTGQLNLLTGGVLNPWNRKTLQPAGSKVFHLAGVTLAGLTTTCVIFAGAAMSSLSTTMPATATAAVNPMYVENFDGSLIVPPGGVLGLFNTNNTTTVNYYGNLVWAEVPV